MSVDLISDQFLSPVLQPPHLLLRLVSVNVLHRPNSTKVLPTAVATGLDIGLGNLALKLITLSMYSACFVARLLSRG